MKRVNMKRILEALTNSPSIPGSSSSLGNSSGGKKDPDFGDNLTVDQFQACKIVRHGFPSHPSALAYDPVQKLLAIGTRLGAIRIFGQPGVDCYIVHETDSAVIQLLFLVNQGALISVCADDQIHLWNLRQKKPAILHSLKFKRERITYCHIPHQSSWLYIGTEKGNVHLCNVESFTLSGYCISWNKAIDLSQKAHPGHVVSICENPVDETKVLISFNSGFVVLWDLKNRSSEQRYYCSSGIRHSCWHFEGKQFMSSHDNGSVTLWNSKSSTKPQQQQYPHAKSDTDTGFPIDKVEWMSCRHSDPFVIFSGGLSRNAQSNPRPSVTVMRGRSITVLEVDFPIVDFTALTSTPWACDYQDPTALAVLTDKELVVIDLEAPGYPSIEAGHAMDIHDSPVTCLKYVPDTYTDLMPGLYQVAASKPRREDSSKKEWPITGGEWSVDDCDGIPEIIVTGHADGSVRFWDASAVFLKALYKLRTKKIFKKDDECENEEDDPFHVTHIAVCPESRTLVISNVSSIVIVYKFNTQESHSEISCLSIHHINDMYDSKEDITNDTDHATTTTTTPTINSLPSETKDDGASQTSETKEVDSQQDPITKQESNENCKQFTPLLRVKNGPLRQSAGFHVELACLLLGNELDPPSSVTYLAINTCYQILSFGTTSSLCIIDLVQKTCLLNISTETMLMCIDKRIQPKSPNKLKSGFSEASQSSFSFDQTTSKSPTESCNGCQNHPPQSLHHLASNQKTAQRELSSSSSSSGTTVQRNKKPPHRINRKPSSLSFDKSVDSTTSADDSAFSRASSLSDERSFPREVVTFLTFAYTYTRKGDNLPSPCLWAGTSSGYVFSIVLNMPAKVEQRSEQLVVSPSGGLFQIKGSIVNCSFLNSSGQLISAGAGNWREPTSTSMTGNVTPRSESIDGGKEKPASIEKQFMVVCSERQAKVFTLPSQTCMHALNFTNDVGYVVQASVDTILHSTCLACYTSNGYILVYSLPSFTPLLNCAYLLANDVRISNTFCFTLNGEAIYLASQSEIQRITYSVETYQSLQEVTGHLFIPRESPERPNPGFLKGLFGGGHLALNRQELFGESQSGKPSRALATHIPGTGGQSLEGLRTSSSGLASDMHRLRMQAQERGEKLSELEDKTQMMHENAMKFASEANALAQKYKNKKWYQM